MISRFCSITLTLGLIAAVAVAVQMASGGYAVSGAVNGTAAVGSPGPGGTQSGQMTTNEFGTDIFYYNPVTDEYIVIDLATGKIVAEFTAKKNKDNPNNYDVTYYNPDGSLYGTGSFQRV